MKQRSNRSGDSFVASFFMGISWLSVLLLWLSTASVYISPAIFPYVALLGLAFPIFLGGTILSTFFSLIFAPKKAWIGLFGILCCIGSIYTYYPINFSQKIPKDAIKVVSYNTHAWDGWATGDFAGRTYSKIAYYLAQQKADIICLQEAMADQNFYEKYVIPTLKRTPYYAVAKTGSNKLAIFSRFPILKQQELCYSGINSSYAFWLRLQDGDTLIVINNHLKSMGLNNTERSNFYDVVKDNRQKANKKTLLRTLKKICNASSERALMAEAVRKFIDQHKDKSMIVCGDFNDSPISYARYKVADGLTDAYKSSGNGIGRSFNQDAIYVRIDHLFCSKNWKPYDCRIDNLVFLSDHYPISAYFSPQKSNIR